MWFSAALGKGRNSREKQKPKTTDISNGTDNPETREFAARETGEMNVQPARQRRTANAAAHRGTPFGEKNPMKYTCTTCGKEHEGIASYAADRPALYWDVPEDKLESDVFLTTDTCVIADRFFFVRGCLDIPIVGTDEVFRWGVWVSLSETNFFIFQDHLEVKDRSHIGPFFGWLCTQIPSYPETLHLKTMVHIQDNGIRPLIVLEPTGHLLAEDQKNGIDMQRVIAIHHFIGHQQNRSAEQGC